jgi:hypothetical protein
VAAKEVEVHPSYAAEATMMRGSVARLIAIGSGTFSLLTLLPAMAIGKEAEGKKPPPVPWTAPVSRAECGRNDRTETGLQGQTSRAERVSGLSELGFNCNLDLVGQFQGEGSKYMMDWFDDCAYYGTTIDASAIAYSPRSILKAQILRRKALS